MATSTAGDNNRIWIQIGANQFELKLKDKTEEKAYRKAEKMLNDACKKYAASFKGKRSNEEIMAMVAFKFAWLVVESNAKSDAVANFLKEFERQLDEIVVKI
ncbi:MAG TPA: cell division protein ZapA [Candidatus Avimuribaculum pullicola]|nr:cell division protein ZapA [Candidatus Avimuribaculum pullicola]